MSCLSPQAQKNNFFCVLLAGDVALGGADAEGLQGFVRPLIQVNLNSSVGNIELS